MDVNRERMIFCATSLVGHKVTAKLRNNAIYEGIFHSCSTDGKLNLTLKCARQLPNEHSKSGEVINTLVIPGNQFLQLSAVDVPPPVGAPEDGAGAARPFAIDSDIAAKRPSRGGDRELVPWTADGEADAAVAGGLEDGDRGGKWDQFQRNQELYGVQSTYDQEHYTTKLDPNAIPQEKRDEADRIAKEIESGQMASEVEDRGDDGDEERKFGAVGGSGAYKNEKAAGGLAGKELAVPAPLTKESLTQHDSASGLPGDSFGRDHRAKRGLNTAHSPMRSPMISEMKRINALNLEPALAKLGDKSRNDLISSKQNQSRNATSSTQANDMKMEFQRSAAEIQKRVQDQERQKQAKNQGAAAPTELEKRGSQSQSLATSTRKSGEMSAGPPSGKSSFNPSAASFNPNASVFTPTNAAQSANQSVQQQAPAASQAAVKPGAPNAPNFSTYMSPSDFKHQTLDRILDMCFERCKGERLEGHAPDWPEAHGSSYHDVLGQPNQQNPLPHVQPMQGGGPGPMPAPWQQQNPGFGMAPVPGGQAQMYPQMCPQMQQRPQGGQNQGPPQQPQQMQFQMMGPQGMQPGQGMMPMGMAGGQGQGPYMQMGQMQGQAFGGQGQTMMVPMMMPAGQGYPAMMAPQGMQGQPGQPGQPGPQGGGPQQGQMMQQQMFMQHRGPGGPQHQMQGHEG